MKLRIVKHRKAKRDALQIFVHIGQNNLDAAERFLQALDSDLRRLAEFPGLGTSRAFKSAKLQGVRSIPITGFTNYLIFYKATDVELQFLRVMHGARDIENAFQQ